MANSASEESNISEATVESSSSYIYSCGILESAEEEKPSPWHPDAIKPCTYEPVANE